MAHGTPVSGLLATIKNIIESNAEPRPLPSSSTHGSDYSAGGAWPGPNSADPQPAPVQPLTPHLLDAASPSTQRIMPLDRGLSGDSGQLRAAPDAAVNLSPHAPTGPPVLPMVGPSQRLQSHRRMLTDERDCEVFDFYIAAAGYWLDIGSPNSFFQRYVPRLAMDEPLVLYASLSCAACLMFLTGKIGRDAEEFYTEKVLDLLIPLLSSEKATSSNQALLATTVILRMSEQFLEPGNDCQRHLKGAASLFMDGTDWSGIEVNLATACFWTHLRESIRKPYWTGDDSQDSYGSSLLKVVTDHGLLNGVSALDDLTTIKFKQVVASSQLSASDAGTTPDLDGAARSVQIPASCDVAGAVYWRQTADSSINAVSTGLIAQIGAILYGITGQDEYRQAADFALDYERRVLLSSTGIIDVDSITTVTCSHNGGSLCYNTGIYIDACTRLYQATSDAQYLDWATLSVTTAVSGVFGNSTSATLVIDQGDNSADTFFSALTEFYVIINSNNTNTQLQDQIKIFVKANRDYVVAHDKQSNNLYSEDWVGQTAGTAWGTGSVLSLFMAAMLML